jgi:hypothetical protein
VILSIDSSASFALAFEQLGVLLAGLTVCSALLHADSLPSSAINTEVHAIWYCFIAFVLALWLSVCGRGWRSKRCCGLRRSRLSGRRRSGANNRERLYRIAVLLQLIQQCSGLIRRPNAAFGCMIDTTAPQTVGPICAARMYAASQTARHREDKISVRPKWAVWISRVIDMIVELILSGTPRPSRAICCVVSRGKGLRITGGVGNSNGMTSVVVNHVRQAKWI